MEKIIEVVEAKIKEYNAALDYNREEQRKLVDRQAVIVLNVQELERELDELRATPKKRTRQPNLKEFNVKAQDPTNKNKPFERLFRGKDIKGVRIEANLLFGTENVLDVQEVIKEIK